MPSTGMLNFQHFVEKDTGNLSLRSRQPQINKPTKTFRGPQRPPSEKDQRNSTRSINLSPQEEDVIKRYISERTTHSNLELEYRFGKNIATGFASPIRSIEIDVATSWLKKSPVYTFDMKKETTIYLYQRDRDTIRLIVEPSRKEEFEIKQQLQKYTDWNTSGDIVTRLTLAKETPLPTSKGRSLTRDLHSLEKKKVTTVYRYTGLGLPPHVIELSTSSITGRRRQYDIELEFTPSSNHISTTSEGWIPKKYRQAVDQLRKAIFPKETKTLVLVNAKTFPYLPGYIPRKGFPLNKAISLERRFLETRSYESYAVTNKLNGVRCVVWVDDRDHTFLIFPTRNFLQQASSKVQLIHGVAHNIPKKTMLDGEWFNNAFYAFDLLYLNGVDHRELPFSQRLSALEKVLPLTELGGSDKVFSRKRFFRPSPRRSIASRVRDTLDYIKQTFSKGNNDGIVFINERKSYSDRFLTFKYKPANELTIDMELRDEGYNIYSLLVSTRDGKEVFVGEIEGDLLNPHSTYTASQVYIDPEHIERLRKKETGPPIYEFKWSTAMGFEAVRFRGKDKTTPNYIEVAKSVWRDIQNPVSESELVSILAASSTVEDVSEYRLVNNKIKTELISTYSNGAVVLDLGIGRGGDIGKYSKSGAYRVYGIDPSEANLIELRKRLATSPPLRDYASRVRVALGRAEDSEAIHRLVGDALVDVVSSFFSLTFFFESEEKLDALLDVISINSKPTAKFIGTVTDGDILSEQLANTCKGEEVDVGFFKVKKEYDIPGGFGKKVIVTPSEKTSIIEGAGQTEWLVDWPILVKKLHERGFELEQTFLPIAPDNWSSANIKSLSLTRAFVFSRIQKSQPTTSKASIQGTLSFYEALLVSLGSKKLEEAQDRRQFILDFCKTLSRSIKPSLWRFVDRGVGAREAWSTLMRSLQSRENQSAIGVTEDMTSQLLSTPFDNEEELVKAAESIYFQKYKKQIRYDMSYFRKLKSFGLIVLSEYRKAEGVVFKNIVKVMSQPSQKLGTRVKPIEAALAGLLLRTSVYFSRDGRTYRAHNCNVAFPEGLNPKTISLIADKSPYRALHSEGQVIMINSDIARNIMDANCPR